MSDKKTECGYVEEESGEPCNFTLTEEERPEHMFHVHGIPSATEHKIFGEDVPKSVRVAQEKMKRREELIRKFNHREIAHAEEPINSLQIDSETQEDAPEIEQKGPEHEQTEQSDEQNVPETEQHNTQESLGIGHTRCPECNEVVSSAGKRKHMREVHGIERATEVLISTNENRLVHPGLICPRCSSAEGFQKWGKKNGEQLWNCKKCKKKFIEGDMKDTNEDRDVPIVDKHLETIRKSYEKQKRASIEAPGKKATYDNSLEVLLLKESQTAHKALDVLLPMIIGTGNSAYLIDALAELHDLRQEKRALMK